MNDQRDRDGRPLLTVETEVNGDSKRTNYRGPSLVSSLDSSCRYNRFLSCFGCSSQPSANYYFPHFFTLLVPIARQPISVSDKPEITVRTITRSSEIQKLRNFDGRLSDWPGWGNVEGGDDISGDLETFLLIYLKNISSQTLPCLIIIMVRRSRVRVRRG